MKEEKKEEREIMSRNKDMVNVDEIENGGGGTTGGK